jgi:hypothetical protein
LLIIQLKFSVIDSTVNVNGGASVTSLVLSNNILKKGIIIVRENKPKKTEKILKIIFNVTNHQ